MPESDITPKKNQLPDDFEQEDIKSALEIRQTGIDHFANMITDVFGSIIFLLILLGVFAVYGAWNLGFLPGLAPFDPYPFNVLDTLLSVFAVILSIAVLISQNRQRRQEKIRAQVEFEVNVRAEREITKILSMLQEIQRELGISKSDPELEKMKETTDLDQLHRSIDENEK